jgi:pyruvate kinase
VRARADAIIAFTTEGRTAQLLSARRPTVPIIAVTQTDEVARRLCLWWGVAATIERSTDEPEGAMLRVAAYLRQHGYLQSPATVVMVSGSPNLDQRASNFLRIRHV